MVINILQLSNTYLNGNPIRLCNLINKHSKDVRSRCIVWEAPKYKDKDYTDLVGSMMSEADIADKIEWAHLIHIHGDINQSLYAKYPKLLSKSQTILQVYESTFDTSKNLSGYINTVVATPRYNTEQNNIDYMVLDPIDITDSEFAKQKTKHTVPIIKVLKGEKPHPFIKPMAKIQADGGGVIVLPNGVYSPAVNREFRKGADLAVDAVDPGSYSTSLDFLASGTPVLALLRSSVLQNISALTGATTIPWVVANRDTFVSKFFYLISQSSRLEREGKAVMQWMHKYWNPKIVLSHYEEMYKDQI